MKAKHLKLGFAVFLVLAAGAALAGHPLVPPDLLAGVGMVGMVGEIELVEIKRLIEDQGRAWEEFKSKNDLRHKATEEAIRALNGDVNDMLKRANRPGVGHSIDGGDDVKAFKAFMRSGIESPELKAMSTQSDPDGGYLVPTFIENILTKNLREISPLRRLARVVLTESGEFKMPHSTGGTGYSWVGETQSRPETEKPGLKMVSVPVKEVYAMPLITQTLLDDNAFDLENWLVEELMEAFGDGEGDAFINGDGVNRPRGLFTYTVVTTADASRDHDKWQYIATGGAGGWAASDPSDALVSLIHAVKPRYRRNASWLLSPEVLEGIRKFKDSQGNYIWKPGLEQGQPSTLLGYPVEEDENLPAIGADSLSAAFGDFTRAYTIVDRKTALLRDPYTQKPFVAFYANKRVGGGAGRDTRSVKFLKFSAS